MPCSRVEARALRRHWLTVLMAIMREVSPTINDCELSYHARVPIDVTKAIAQHEIYRDCLAELGVKTVMLPAEPDLPDAVFVEDPVVVVDEAAVITIMGAPSRRPEGDSLAKALSRHRPLRFMEGSATLDGGDVLRIGRRIFVGASQRTNEEGARQLAQLLGEFGYEITPVPVLKCLHLKSGCSYIGKNTILVNRSWIDAEALAGFRLLDVPNAEPAAANALVVGDVVILPASFPQTRDVLEHQGFSVRTVDVSELQKAEAGVSCCSILFDCGPASDG